MHHNSDLLHLIFISSKSRKMSFKVCPLHLPKFSTIEASSIFKVAYMGINSNSHENLNHEIFGMNFVVASCDK